MTSKLKDYENFNPDILSHPGKLSHSLLLKTLNKFAACNEVGSVEAAATLLGHPDHYTSGVFVSINWKGWDLWVCQKLASRYSNHSYTRLQDRSHTYYKVLERAQKEHYNCDAPYQCFYTSLMNTFTAIWGSVILPCGSS
ncbi:hypothetical protein BC833DRAFT_533724 [Globomyces pollinis-pini]|nr:hypothetical protein BC833DRAFT_533724 [Globomyces pollinis-pini]